MPSGQREQRSPLGLGPRPINEHIGELIARLMDYSPDPEAALAYAMAARQGPGVALAGDIRTGRGER